MLRPANVEANDLVVAAVEHGGTAVARGTISRTKDVVEETNATGAASGIRSVDLELEIDIDDQSECIRRGPARLMHNHPSLNPTCHTLGGVDEVDVRNDRKVVRIGGDPGKRRIDPIRETVSRELWGDPLRHPPPGVAKIAGPTASTNIFRCEVLAVKPVPETPLCFVPEFAARPAQL